MPESKKKMQAHTVHRHSAGPHPHLPASLHPGVRHSRLPDAGGGRVGQALLIHVTFFFHVSTLHLQQSKSVEHTFAGHNQVPCLYGVSMAPGGSTGSGAGPVSARSGLLFLALPGLPTSCITPGFLTPKVSSHCLMGLTGTRLQDPTNHLQA